MDKVTLHSINMTNGRSRKSRRSSNENSFHVMQAEEAVAVNACVTCEDTEQLIIECEVCSKHYCIDCVSLGKAAHKALKGCASAHWYCPQCEPRTLKVIKADLDVEDRCNAVLKAMEDKMEDKITTLRAEFQDELSNKVSKAEMKDLVAEQIKENGNQSSSPEEKEKEAVSEVKVKEVVSAMLGNHNTEQKDKEARKRNILVHHVDEHTNPETDSTKKQELDKEFLTELTSVLGVPEVGISNIFRLGKVPVDDNAKSRPMKVVFDTEENKKSFMKNLGKLATADDKFKKISIAHDMTQDERAANKKLVEEAKNLASKDPHGKWAYRVKGLPGMQKIVQVAKTQQ